MLKFKRLYFLLGCTFFLGQSQSLQAQTDDDLLEEDTLSLSRSNVPELEAAKKANRELKKKNTSAGSSLG